MNETRNSYVRRVFPDLVVIEGSLRNVLANTEGNPRFYLAEALSRAQKMVEDLKRAERAEE